MEIRKPSHDTDGGKLVETIKISRMRGKGKATINVAEMSVVRGTLTCVVFTRIED